MADLLTIAQRVLGWANDNEDVEVVAVHDRDTEIRVYQGEIEQFTASESQGVGIRVISDSRQGFAYAGTLDEDVLAETLREARDNAAFGTPDEFLGLAQPDGVPVPSLDLFDERVGEMSTDAKIDLAVDLEARTLAGDPRISGIESADYVDSVSESALVSSAGIEVTSKDSGSYVAVYAMAEENDETQVGFGFSVNRDPAALDVARAASDAAERATRLLGAVQPSSERVTVIFDPFVTSQFLSILGETMSGEAVLKGYSLFANRMGDDVASPLFTLVDDPTNREAFTAAEADGEGLASRRNVLIDEGRLSSFVHNAYTGRRMGTASTGSAVRSYSSVPGVGARALFLQPGTQSQEELVAGIDNGVLIQGVAGIHSGVNPVSGDFSTGAEGLRIRNGQLGEPLREITIASTLQRMLADVQAVGNDVDWLPMSAAGVSLVIADVTMSGS
ncbi:MAG: TldD/PmbA family protein [Acidimicrobiia bacterium]|nr:TldD/PmbA family protein [Acidimicrobiia bacterium]